MESITTKPSTQSLSHGKCGRMKSIQRVDFSDSGAFSAGVNLYYPGHVEYLEAISTNIITHAGNIYREHQNLDNSYVNRKVPDTR